MTKPRVVAKLVETKAVKCPTCEGKGKLVFGDEVANCIRCGGSGTVRV